MNRNLYVYKCGQTFKIVSVAPINGEVNHNIQKNHLNSEKLYHNLIRAKSTIKDLILCNDFKYFVTLTINGKHDRFDLKKIRESITRKIRKTRLKHYQYSFEYILIPERHKNGAFHLHGVFSGDFSQFLYTNSNGYSSCSLFDYLGFSSVSTIGDKQKVSSYVLKYITKDFDKREKGSHLFFCSQGLQKPVLIKNYEYINSKFDNLLYKNDYCYFKYTDKLDNLPIRLIK